MIEDANVACLTLSSQRKYPVFPQYMDSIQYTQELLDNNVGVLFQNDNINTLDSGQRISSDRHGWCGPG